MEAIHTGVKAPLVRAARAELDALERASVFIATVDDEHTQGGPVPPEVVAEATSAYDLFHQVAVQVTERKRS